MSYRNSFISGELTPWLDGLTNLEQYGVGCREMRNVIATPYGGARRRPGTWLDIHILTWHSTYKEEMSAVTIPFSFSSDDSTLLKISSYQSIYDTSPNQRLMKKVNEINSYVVGDPTYIYGNYGENYTCINEIHQSSIPLTDLYLGQYLLNSFIFDTLVNDFLIINDTLVYQSVNNKVYQVIQKDENTVEVTYYLNGVGITVVDLPTSEIVIVKSGETLTIPTNWNGFSHNDNGIFQTLFDNIEEREAYYFGEISTWIYVADLPYSYDEIREIKYRQSADVIFLTHPNHPPAKISRISKEPNVFNYDVLEIVGPYAPRNIDTEKLLTPVVNVWESGVTDEFSYGDTVVVKKVDKTVTSIPYLKLWNGGSSFNNYTYDYKLYVPINTADLYVNDWVIFTSNGNSTKYKIERIGAGYIVLNSYIWERGGVKSDNWPYNLSNGDTITPIGGGTFLMIDSTNFDIDPELNAPLTTGEPSVTPLQWEEITSRILKGDITMTASWDEFTADSVGEKYLIYQDLPQARYEFNGSGAPSGGSGEEWLAKTYQTSNEWYVGSTIEVTTYGAWKGTVVVEVSYDSGVSWTTITTFINPVEAKNYTEEIELDGKLQLIRGRTLNDYNDLGTTDPDIKLVIRPVEQEVGTDVEVIEYISATEVVVSINGALTNSNPTYNWAYNEFTSLRGYPSTLEIFENRLLFASTNFAYNTIWASKVDDWYNFDIGSKATDGWSYKLPEQDNITYIKEKGKLFIGTGGGDWILTGSQNEIVSATNVKLSKNSNRGSNGIVEIVDDALFFVGKDGRSLFNYVYDYVSDSFQAEDLTLLAKHIFEENKIIDMKLQRRPYTIIWCLLDNGQLAGLTYNKKMGVVAWHVHEIKQYDAVEEATRSLAVIPSEDEDVLYINDDNRGEFLDSDSVYINLLMMDEILNTKIYLDYAEREQTHPYSNPVYIPENWRFLLRDSYEEVAYADVSDPKYNDVQYPKFVSGYIFTSTLTTTPIDMSGQDGRGNASKRQIPEVWIKVIETGNLQVGTKDISGESKLTYWKHTYDESKTPIIANKIFQVNLKDKWERDKMVTVVSDDIYPMNIIYIETNDLRGE